MKIIANKENNQASLEIELNGEELKPFIEEAITEKIANLEVDGFRKGKMPRDMFIKKYGVESVYNDVIDSVLNKYYIQLIEENELDVVAAPNFNFGEMKISEEGFSVTGTVDLLPQITVQGYADIKNEVTKEEVKVEEEEIDATIKTLLEDKAMVEISETDAKTGDTVVIDFEGFVDGEAFEGGKAENHELKLGSGAFIPGFEDQLVGKKAGDSLDVVVTFPEEYQAADLAGKEATFKTTVHEVKVTVIPELNAEIISEIEKYEVETEEQLREEIKKELEASKTEAALNKYNSDIITKLIDSADFEVPQSMIDQETNAAIENFKQQLEAQGMDFNMYVQMMGGDESTLRAQINPESKRRIQEMLVMEAVVKEEKFEITDEEVEEKIDELVEQTQMSKEEVMEALGGDKERLKANMVYDKAYKLVLGE